MALTNAQMKPKRFYHWAVARKKAAKIQAHLAAGKAVAIGTQTRCWILKAKHAAMIKATKSGLFMQRGKAWDCIDYCAIRFEV